MSRNLTRVKNFLRDKEKKSYPRMLKEFIQLWIHKKQIPYHYIGRFFYKKNAPENIKDYLSIQDYNKLINVVTIKSQAFSDSFKVINEKMELSKFGFQNNIKTPEIISYNLRNDFYYNNAKQTIEDINDFKDFFESVMKDKNKSALFVKPNEAEGGTNAMRLDFKKLSENVYALFDLITNDDFVHQEVITQHKEISAFYANAINTLRLETYRDKKGKTHVLGAFMRFGVGGLEVDNGSSGGLFVNLDVESGTLFKYARNKLKYGSTFYTSHPDSGTVFDGFKIPFYAEALNLVKELSESLEYYIIGWDLAITENGPVIIEGNHTPGLFNSEYSYYGYKNHKAFEEIMQDVEDYYKNP